MNRMLVRAYRFIETFQRPSAVFGRWKVFFIPQVISQLYLQAASKKSFNPIWVLAPSLKPDVLQYDCKMTFDSGAVFALDKNPFLRWLYGFCRFFIIELLAATLHKNDSKSTEERWAAKTFYRLQAPLENQTNSELVL